MEQFGAMYVALAATFGGILLWLIGFLKSNEDFAPKKAALSFILALLAGLGFGLSYGIPESQVTIIDIFQAVLAGAGVGGIAYGTTSMLTKS